MILYLLLTLFAIRSLQLLLRGHLINTLGINLSNAGFDSGSESGQYMITLPNSQDVADGLEDGDGNKIGISILTTKGETVNVASNTWTAIRTFNASDVETGVIMLHGQFTHGSVVAFYQKVYNGSTADLAVGQSSPTNNFEIRANGNAVEVRHQVGSDVDVKWAFLSANFNQ